MHAKDSTGYPLEVLPEMLLAAPVPRLIFSAVPVHHWLILEPSNTALH
jgi:hypothetical protein